MTQDLARYLDSAIDGATALETLQSIEELGRGRWNTFPVSAMYNTVALAWSHYRKDDYVEAYRLSAPILRALQS